MRDELFRFGTTYADAQKEHITANPTARFIRNELADAVAAGLGASAPGLMVTASPGAGVWATVPWIGIFIPHVTETATEGYYAVYLLAPSTRELFLSLNQGTTAVTTEFKSKALDVLRERAALMRARIPEFLKHFCSDPISLKSDRRLPRAYEAGHALGLRYEIDALPAEEVLRLDLERMIQAYRTLDFRGGLDPSVEAGEMSGTSSPPKEEEDHLLEVRRYKLHIRIERNRKASERAKQHHGYVCQACSFSFEDHYGELGRGFIEAHHLKPLGSLDPGVAVTYNVATDFAVLCSNCHSMIHRTENPGDLGGFKARTRRNRT
jgi:5-methylcytosine-specific restriction enzyme A